MPSPLASSPQNIARNLLLDGVRRLVPDDRVISAMQTVPREMFVRADERAFAYANRSLAADGGGVVPEPLVVARVLAALTIASHDRVLVVGGDGGYVAAVTCRLARDVTVVEARLTPALERRLQTLGVRPCLVEGPLLDGFEEQAPFDAIVVTSPHTEMPPALVTQLGLGGRLAIPMRDADGELLARVVREGLGRLRLDRLGELRASRASWPPMARAG